MTRTTTRTTRSDDREERFAPYVEAWCRRFAVQAEEDRRHAEEAWEEARQATAFLAEHYGVRRVVLFGSLPAGRFREGSDVDLAVDGLAPERFFRADGQLAWNATVPIDLKLFSDCPPSLLERIEREGVVLHER